MADCALCAVSHSFINIIGSSYKAGTPVLADLAKNGALDLAA